MDPGLKLIAEAQLQLCSTHCHNLSHGMNSSELMKRILELSIEIGSNLDLKVEDYPISIYALTELELAKWHRLLWKANRVINRYKRLNRAVEGWNRFKRRFR